ncbi:MAG: hypothetical protein Crog4KO_33900 [Crocinitomicaceae bacterium]
MIGLLLLFFMARWVVNLAKEYKKPNTWLYGVLAVVTYYAIVIAVSFLIVFILLSTNSSIIDNPNNDIWLSLIAIPFGFGGVALLRYFLKRNWSKTVHIESEILDETTSEL